MNKNKSLFKILVFCFVLLSLIATPTLANKLIVVPGDKIQGFARDSFTNIIDSAQNKIDLAMYQIKDQGMIEALLRATQRGVKLRIITELNPYKHSYNQDKNKHGGLKQLEKNGIPIKGLPHNILANNPNAHAHYKFLIIDDRYAVVMSCNWDTPTLANTRDFALILSKEKNPIEFWEINRIFNADWQNKKISSTRESLIVGPDHQREKFIKLFSKAHKSIEIYQQSYNDEKIAQALENRCRKGIKVKLLMMPFPFGGSKDKNLPFQIRLVKTKGEVRLVKTRYIHAKVVIIDGKIAYIGSCNFYPHSLNFNREIGVITKNQQAVQKLKDTFDQDWKIAEPLAATSIPFQG